MSLRATVLCENSVFSNLGAIAEHGWSVFLETDRGNFLFDTGQGLGLLNNARVFKKDLSSISGIILSHHHCDHTGGLLDALTASGPVKVYAHPELFKEGYLVRKGRRFIGVPFSRAAIEGQGAELVLDADFSEIAPGIYLSGEIPRLTDYEEGDCDIVVRSGDGFTRDSVMDDQSLYIDTERGLVIILGCSHAGIVNIIEHAIARTGTGKIHAVIGGTHLWTVSEEQRARTIEALGAYDIERLGVSHCTGLDVSMRLAQAFKDRFFFFNVGCSIEA